MFYRPGFYLKGENASQLKYELAYFYLYLFLSFFLLLRRVVFMRAGVTVSPHEDLKILMRSYLPIRDP